VPIHSFHHLFILSSNLNKGSHQSVHSFTEDPGLSPTVIFCAPRVTVIDIHIRWEQPRYRTNNLTRLFCEEPIFDQHTLFSSHLPHYFLLHTQPESIA
jgi:hypothetical protein